MDTVFYENEGETGGGIGLNNSASIIISDTEFVSNTARNAGAGISVYENSSAVIHGAQIYGNTARDGQGGGIAIESGDVHLGASWVVGNAAENNEGGGIAVGEDGSLYVENSIIAGNSSTSAGGGMWFTSGGPYAVVNSDIVGNEADGDGAGLAATHGVQVGLTNTLVITNQGASGIGDRDESGSTFALNYCDTWGNSPDGTGLTILRTNCLGSPPEDGLDPLFAGGDFPTGSGPAFADEWLAYDFRLEPGSPAINAGTPDGAPEDDIVGTPRDATPDMGAYERPGYTIYLPIVRNN
jgi:hypothetical protein